MENTLLYYFIALMKLKKCERIYEKISCTTIGESVNSSTAVLNNGDIICRINKGAWQIQDAI